MAHVKGTKITAARAGALAPTWREVLRTLIGFACNQAFLFSLFYMGWNRSAALGPWAFERIDVFFALISMACVLAILRRVTPLVRDAVLTRNLLWCYAFLMALGASVTLPLDTGVLGLVIEGLVVGAPFGCMLGAWGRAFMAIPHAQSVRGVLLSTALAAVFSFLLSAFSGLVPQVLYLANLLPFAAAFLLSRTQPFRDGAQRKGAEGEVGGTPAGTTSGAAPLSERLLASKEERVETMRLSRKVVSGAVLFGVSGGLMETYASDPGMVATPTFPATLLLLALFCVGSLQVIGLGGPAREGDENVSALLVSVYRMAMLVMLAGYLFIPVLEPFGVPGDAIVLAGYLGLSAVLISLFVLMAKIAGADGALSFSRGFAALYFGEAAGLALGNVLQLASPGGDMPFAVASSAGLVTLFVYLFLFTEADFLALSRIVRQADRFGDACRAIAERCKLSKRETEILPMALRGRTAERIAAELFIAKSTVDTHLRRIYAKCGVHTRQELIDLGEAEAQSLLDRKE